VTAENNLPAPIIAGRACPAAAALSVVGEKWALLTIREIFYGNHRFDQIVRNTGAPRDRLAARLRALTTAGVLERRMYQERPQRFEYHLTAAGKDLRPVLLTLLQWGKDWTSPTCHQAGSGEPGFTHSCGERLRPEVVCQACRQTVTGDDLHPLSESALSESEGSGAALEALHQ
jgi:DNA-binding HxlR family transcriptional regulator